jgi:hypothetical protein
MSEVAELVVTVSGRDVGVSEILARVKEQAQGADVVAQDLATTLGGSLTAAQQAAATSATALQSEVVQVVAQLRAAVAAAGGGETEFLGLAGALSQQALAAGNAAQATTILDAAMGGLVPAAAETVAVTQRAADADLRLAQQRARLVQITEGNAAAEGVLQGALQSTTGASERAILSVETQIARMQTGAGSAAQYGEALAGSFTSMLGPMALVTVGLGAITAVPALITLGAQAEQAQTRFNSLASTAGSTGSALLQMLKVASHGEMSDLALQLAADRAELEGVAHSAQDFANLMSIARDRGQEFGVSTEDAFNKIVQGIGTMQVRGLKSLGLTVNLKDAEAAYAKQLGVTVSALDDEQKKQALANAVMQQGLASINQTGGAIDGQAAKLQQLGANWENVKEKVGGFLGEAVAPTIAGLNAVFDGSAATSEGFRQLAEVEDLLSGRFGSLVASEQQLASAGPPVAASLAAVSFAARDDAAETARLSQANQDSAVASGTDAEQKQLQALQTQLVHDQALNAANAFLALNPTINASGIQSAVTAGAITPLIGRLAELIGQVNAARAALGALSGAQGGTDFRAGERTGGQARTISDEGQLAAAHANTARAAAAAHEAELKYQQTLKNFGPSIAAAQAELAQLPKGTEAYFNKLIEIQQLKEREASAARKAGGAAHLSDQAKLNNALAGDQQKFDDQSEARETDHIKKLLQIQTEYDQKSLAQQKANEISKRESEIGFLDALTGSELNASKTGKAELARIDAQYYKDFDAAQKAAQAGNVKQSEEMVKEAKHRADVELSYAERIDKAQKDKNASEVARLTALREKERQLLTEQEKQTKAGGDPIEQAKQDALAAEDQRYADSQGKAGTAAEAASQRKVDAAARSGKAVTDENTALLDQEKILNRIGPKQPVGGAAGPASAPSPAPTSTTAAATPTGLGAVVSALQSAAERISVAVGHVEDAVKSDTRETVGAVKGLGGRALV